MASPTVTLGQGQASVELFINDLARSSRSAFLLECLFLDCWVQSSLGQTHQYMEYRGIAPTSLVS